MNAVRKPLPEPDALALAHELDDLADAEARGEIQGPPLHRGRTQAGSEVFSVRLPAAAAEKLRLAAEQAGMSPGVLIRQLALSALNSAGEPAVTVTLTRSQVQQMFKEALESAMEQAQPLNIGPRRVHESYRDRRHA